MDALEQARAEIDTVDAQLAALFERRMAAVLQVAEYKRAHGLPIYDAAREAAVLEKAAARIQQMQEQVNAAQEAVEAQEFTASVGGGVVEAKVNGKKEVLAVTIKPEAVDPEDVEMLQDLVVSAVNEALRQAGEAMDKSIEQATGGLDLGAFGL